MSHVDRQQVLTARLDEQALRVFEPKLQALNLGLDQIEQQTLPELEAGLERIADAMHHPEQFGTLRMKMTADAGIVVARTTTEAQFEVGILPILLQRKARVLERIKSLRPEGQLSDLRRHIIQRIDDVAVREDLLNLVEKQLEQQHDTASQLDAQSREASQAMEAERQSILCAVAVAAARSGAARIARIAIRLVEIVIVMVVLFAAMAAAVPALLGSAPLWMPLTLAAILAVPVVLDILDKLTQGASEGRRRPPLKFLASKIEAAAYRMLLRRVFADQGVEEFAAAAKTAGLLSASEATWFTLSSRMRRRRRVRVAAAALTCLLVIASTWIWWPSPNRDLSAAIGQSVDLAGVFRLTVTAPPTCTPTSTDTPATCTVIVELVNISGEDQVVGAGSFGDIGPKGATFYYTITPEDRQDYAIAAVLKNQFFRMNSASRFDKNALHAGESTRATLDFDVRDGVTTLDEIQLAVRHVDGRIHVRLI